MNHLVSVLRLLAIVFGFEILVILMLASGPSLLAGSNIDDFAALPETWLHTDHQDTILKPTPSPLVAQPPITPSDGHLEGDNFGWSQFKTTVSYHVVDQCLCPPHMMATTSPHFNNNQTEDDCSFSSVLAHMNGNIH